MVIRITYLKVKSFTRIPVVYNLTNEGLLGELLVNLATLMRADLLLREQ